MFVDVKFRRIPTTEKSYSNMIGCSCSYELYLIGVTIFLLLNKLKNWLIFDKSRKSLCRRFWVHQIGHVERRTRITSFIVEFFFFQRGGGYVLSSLK